MTLDDAINRNTKAPEDIELFDENDVTLPNPVQCRRAIVRILRQIHRGTLTVGQGNALVQGVLGLAKLIEDSSALELAKRLEVAEKRKQQPRGLANAVETQVTPAAH